MTRYRAYRLVLLLAVAVSPAAPVYAKSEAPSEVSLRRAVVRRILAEKEPESLKVVPAGQFFAEWKGTDTFINSGEFLGYPAGILKEIDAGIFRASAGGAEMVRDAGLFLAYPEALALDFPCGLFAARKGPDADRGQLTGEFFAYPAAARKEIDAGGFRAISSAAVREYDTGLFAAARLDAPRTVFAGSFLAAKGIGLIREAFVGEFLAFSRFAGRDYVSGEFLAYAARASKDAAAGEFTAYKK